MYKSKISAGSLYHFTKDIEIVLSIIKNGFYPRVTKEDMNFLMKKHKHSYIGTPMVCFTDIPIDHLEEHTNQYGNYGIGMNKKWGIKSGLNPILYIVDDSDLNKAILNLQSFIIRQNMYNENNLMEVGNLFWSMAGYFKRYMEKESVKPYYDEREWRYLVPFSEGEYTYRLINNDLTDERIKKLNLEVQYKFPLKFVLDDIDCIIIPNEEDTDIIKYKIYNDSDLNEEEKEIISNKLKTKEELCM